MILVTGGAGFIGSNLQAALAARGHETVVVDWLGSEDKWRNLAKHPPAQHHPADELDAFLSGRPPVEMVFHLGAVSATTARDGDLPGRPTSNSAAGCGSGARSAEVRLVYASSAATYGDGARGFDDEFSVAGAGAAAAAEPVWLDQARVRPAGGAVRWRARRERPPQWAGLKFFNVYGPNEYHKGSMISVVKVKYDEVAAGGPVRLFRSDVPGLPDGEQERDFIWVGDVVDVHAVAAGHAGGERAVQPGHRAGADLSGPGPRGVRRRRHGRARWSSSTCRRACSGQYQSFTEAPMDRLRAAGYAGQFTPLEEGIRRYVQDHLATADRYV